MIRFLCRHARLRLLAAIVTLAAFGVVWFGVLPSPAAIGRWVGGRVSGPERYPCEAHGCGCSSAEECWHDCCCYTLDQRLVWAIRNGVQPPDDVHVTEAEWIAAANAVEPGSATCFVCVDHLIDDLSRGVGLGTRDEASSTPPPAAMSPAGCKRLASLIVLSLPPARGSAAQAWEMDLTVCCAAVRVDDPLPPGSRTLDAPVPPPRA
ncbi:MAG: hypothetical protein Kow0022_11770 [Phycisphaerales bacterium]